MGEIDTLTKNYLSEKKRFADLFNVLVFHREEVDHTKLKEEDTSLTDPSLTIQRQRDVLKVMEDGKRKMVLLGVENQTNIHPRMPLRVMEYDALTYKRQKQKHLIPVVTVVLYWGNGPWKGPRSLFDIMDPEYRERYRGIVQDYAIKVLAPYELEQRDLSALKSDLRLVLQAIKYSDDKEQFLKVIEEDEGYRKVERKTAELIGAVTGTELVYNEEKEEVDMCEAIRQLMQEATDKGIAQGVAQGVAQGEIKGAFHTALDLGKSEEDAYEYVSSRFQIPVSEIREILKRN